MSSDVTRTLAEALANLEGRQLSSVEFLVDYLQLRFDGPCLTAYRAPTINDLETARSFAEPGYRDVLCAQIGSRVERVETNDQSVSVQFASGSSIAIPLQSENRAGPEALQFSLDDQNIWVA